MSRFYASIQGSRGMATRQGGKSGGIWGHIRGWHIGARVTCHVNDQDKDVVRVYKTSGSTNRAGDELIAEFTEG